MQGPERHHTEYVVVSLGEDEGMLPSLTHHRSRWPRKKASVLAQTLLLPLLLMVLMLMPVLVRMLRLMMIMIMKMQ
jgi:hypothetical protein